MLKSNIKFFLALFMCIGITLISCTNITEKLSNRSKIFYGFIAEIGQKLGKKYNMEISGLGGGAKEGIWLMSIDFHRYGPLLKEEEARKFIIKCLTEVLEEVNKSEKLRPFLKTYPFTPENIDLGIINYKTDKKDVFYPYIGTISASEGKIGYFTMDESNEYAYKTKNTSHMMSKFSKTHGIAIWIPSQAQVSK